jgi:hypothetical protein
MKSYMQHMCNTIVPYMHLGEDGTPMTDEMAHAHHHSKDGTAAGHSVITWHKHLIMLPGIRLEASDVCQT